MKGILWFCLDYLFLKSVLWTQNKFGARYFQKGIFLIRLPTPLLAFSVTSSFPKSEFVCRWCNENNSRKSVKCCYTKTQHVYLIEKH